MDDIELDNINKGREEERSGQDREREETSFTERSEETKDDYDDIRSRIDSDPADQGETSKGFDDDEDDLSERLQDQTFKKEMIRFKTIQALELATESHIGKAFNFCGIK